ncbi:MAG: three-Cys-motif partner protein TcmP [candidate division Zixibacteria bacterium]|nr:three-Cys-motif partner protein TcmP [candidate division Zixibacteria bacterium]
MRVNTEKTFFKGKRPWSKIKDAVLRDYLPPYLKKVGKLGHQIILVDAFAGPGIFEDEKDEDRLGSPLIILQNAENYVPGRYFAIFVNSNKDHDKKLKQTIKKYKSSLAILGTARELLDEIRDLLTNQTLFIYLDPFGLKDLDFSMIEPFLKRDISYSTEILINTSMPTLHRLATRKLQSNSLQTARSIKLNQILTCVLGGDYWKEIMWEDSLSPEEKEIKVMENYRKVLKNYLPYTGSCPVRVKEKGDVKYFITFCSRHPDAMLLMNDAMCKAYFKHLYETEYSNTIFRNTNWKEWRNLIPLKKTIIKELKARQRQTRLDLWNVIIQKHFMEFHSSEYKKIVKQLFDEGQINYENPRKTGKLNDDCILFLINKYNNSNSINITLIKEGGIKYQQLKNNIYNNKNRIKVYFNEYKVINGKTRELFSRINDGSIITRFDKTPLPQRPEDVICPHFVELKWAYGCPYDCAWCYLKGTFRFHSTKTLPVVKPYEKIELHTRKFLDEVNNPEILNTGEIADSLMHENDELPFSKFIIPIFETQKLHKVLFLTKSSNVKNLLEIEPHNQVIMSFSLNAVPVAKKWEKAASILSRIEAAKKVFEAGYEVRVRIDPMVPIEDWGKHYLNLLDMIFENFVPERITLGSLRGLQSTINGCTDRSWVKYLKESSNWGRKVDFKTRHEMYSEIIQQLRTKYSFDKIALCKETVQTWKALKMDYKKIRCNCV